MYLSGQDNKRNGIRRKGGITNILEQWIDRRTSEFAILKGTAPRRHLHVAVMKLASDEIRDKVGVAKRRSRKITIGERTNEPASVRTDSPK